MAAQFVRSLDDMGTSVLLPRARSVGDRLLLLLRLFLVGTRTEEIIRRQQIIRTARRNGRTKAIRRKECRHYCLDWKEDDITHILIRLLGYVRTV